MQIGLIGDIHGNFMALEQVLSELARERVERIVCLGDISSLGPQPRQVIARLRDLACPVILGNTDAWLLDPPSIVAGKSDSQRAMYEIAGWCAEQLREEHREYVRALPPTLEIALDGARKMLLFHGSPRSFDDVIAATTPDDVVGEMLGGAEAAVYAGGHTHIPLIRRYRDSFIVNPGSVGLPGVNAGSPELPLNHDVHWAEYGVLRVEQDRLSIELRRTPLNLRAILAEARHSGMPHLDWWLGKWAAV